MHYWTGVLWGLCNGPVEMTHSNRWPILLYMLSHLIVASITIFGWTEMSSQKFVKMIMPSAAASDENFLEMALLFQWIALYRILSWYSSCCDEAWKINATCFRLIYQNDTIKTPKLRPRFVCVLSRLSVLTSVHMETRVAAIPTTAHTDSLPPGIFECQWPKATIPQRLFLKW